THFWLYAAWFTVGKLQYMFSDLWVTPHGTFLDMFSFIHQWIAYLGASAMLLYRRLVKLRPIILLVVFQSVVQLLFVPITRYAFPVMPFLTILAASLIVLLVFGERSLQEEHKLVITRNSIEGQATTGETSEPNMI
ncbi:MAG: hypothetical protein JWN30_133, partial [Bacilli bacterium]|nr:hypothetical protein [Bacilli bacterium]